MSAARVYLFFSFAVEFGAFDFQINNISSIFVC